MCNCILWRFVNDPREPESVLTALACQCVGAELWSEDPSGVSVEEFH